MPFQGKKKWSQVENFCCKIQSLLELAGARTFMEFQTSLGPKNRKKINVCGPYWAKWRLYYITWVFTTLPINKCIRLENTWTHLKSASKNNPTQKNMNILLSCKGNQIHAVHLCVVCVCVKRPIGKIFHYSPVCFVTRAPTGYEVIL